jgi:pimeloyl-ACP methyl ester carboxylesterase
MLRTTSVVTALLVVVATASASEGAVRRARVDAQTPTLEWATCGVGLQCTTAEVPRDYSASRRGSIRIALIRRPAKDPAERIGSVFLNPGGPGASGVALVRAYAGSAFAALNRRFDLVGFDPRGVGGSDPSVRCLTDAEAKTQFSAPFVRPESLDVPALRLWASAWVDKCVARNHRILPYLSTANAARDLDGLRAAVGDPKLTYLGFSYGTLLGATYATLFPRRVRALALDGAVDADLWMHRPLEATREQVARFERELQRFFVACARRTWCTFGGGDPERAFEDLVERLDRNPIPAGAPYDSRPVTGETLLVAAAFAMDSKPLWANLSGALTQAAQGTGTVLRGLADLYWGISANGAYDGVWDRNLVISALDQRTPRRIGAYLIAGRDANALFPHFWWSSGYSEVPWGLLSVRPRGVFRGPFVMPSNATPALVVGTSYDPSTPYVWAQRLTAQLGNARLLTMVGDGHTAFLNYSSCVQKAVTAYLETLVLPDEGTKCGQDLDLALSAEDRRRARSRAARTLLRRRSRALHGLGAPRLLPSASVRP